MDTILLIGMILCAVPYAFSLSSLIVYLVHHPKVFGAWLLTGFAIMAWPVLALMSFMQLIVAIPVITVFSIHQYEMSKTVAWKPIGIGVLVATAMIIIACGVVFFAGL